MKFAQTSRCALRSRRFALRARHILKVHASGMNQSSQKLEVISKKVMSNRKKVKNRKQAKKYKYDYLIIVFIVIALILILLFGIPSWDYYPGKP